jgi:hypothetical protein
MQSKRKPGSHGPQAISRATRRRLLSDLLTRAENGDAVASGMLIALSLHIEAETFTCLQKPETAAA